MRTILTSVCAITLVFGAAAFAAQDKGADSRKSKEVQQDTKTMTTDSTTKTSTDTVYGKVESYDAGKTIKVSIPGKIVSTKSFDLDTKNATVNVAPGIKVGEWVMVAEKTDNNGHKTINVEPSSEQQASRMKKTSH